MLHGGQGLKKIHFRGVASVVLSMVVMVVDGVKMNVFSCLRNLSWPNPSCDYQMNGKDIRLSYMNLQGILDSKRTIRYGSISDILISMFLGINKCSQGRNIFIIDFSSSQYQKFVISLICVSAEFPAYIMVVMVMGRLS